jgi:glucose-1-phosphate cytidylyltransferase
MKAVILAGGFGTRLSEETDMRPKPLVEIGGKPIIWHIMKTYAAAGIDEFVVCCGYKGSMLKHYFAQYFLETSDITVDLKTGDIEYINRTDENWKITLVDTGINTMTGGRIRRVKDQVGNSTFCLTYGDGLIDADIADIVDFHRRKKKLATVTAVPSPGRFGILDMSGDDDVRAFLEKPNNEMGYINAGFFVLEPAVIDYIKGDGSIWEREPLERIAAEGELVAYKHHGFWRPMDTLRDKRELEGLWDSGNAPWKRD